MVDLLVGGGGLGEVLAVLRGRAADGVFFFLKYNALTFRVDLILVIERFLGYYSASRTIGKRLSSIPCTND